MGDLMKLISLLLTLICGLVFLLGIKLYKSSKDKEKLGNIAISMAFVVMIGLILFDLIPEIKDNFHAKGLTEAKKKLDILKLSKEEREIYDAYQFELHYQASMFLSTYTLGNIEGNIKGRQEGREEGIELGELKKAKEIAIKAKQNNLPVETIIALTGLSKEDIQKL